MSFEFIKNIINDVKKRDKDVNDYKRVVQNPSMPSLAYVNWAAHLMQIGNVKDAEEKLIASTLMAHQTPESYISLGILKTKERQFEEAKRFYIKAIRIDNNNSKAYCFLANVLTEMHDFKEAESQFEYASKIDPNNPDISLNWGISLIRQKKFLAAKEKFERACKLNPSNYTALYFLGLVDLEMEEFDNAKNKFKAITAAVPSHYEALYYLAYIYFKQKDFQKSIDCAMASLSVFDKKIETYMLISESHMNLKNEEECFKYYILGEQSCTATYYFLLSWGISLQEFSRYEESKSMLQKAIDIDDKNELSFVYLGVSCYKTDDYDRAVTLFQKTLELNPQNILALDNLGQISFDRENYAEAIRFFELVLSYSAKVVSCYGKIAKSYFLDGNIQKANSYYNKAIEYQPEAIQLYIDYANALMDQREYDSALKKLQTAYKLDDKNLDCLNLLFFANYILAKENISDYNIEKALEIANKIEAIYPDSFIYSKEKEELVAINRQE